MKLRENGIWIGLVIAILIVALILLQNVALADALYTITVSDYCNVRESPDKDSADTGDLYAGETVEGIGYQSGWVQVVVNFERSTGWVRADLLTLADYPVGRYTNSTGGRANIRKTPDGKHAHWLDAGHTVDVIRWVDMDGVARIVYRAHYRRHPIYEPDKSSSLVAVQVALRDYIMEVTHATPVCD